MPPPPIQFDATILAALACPACYGDLRCHPQTSPSRLVCASCGRAYPILDGIPVLIVDRDPRSRSHKP